MVNQKSSRVLGVIAVVALVCSLSTTSALADSSGTLLPTADGYSTQWTPSTGTTHYTLVNESVCDGSTSYVQTTTAGQRDAYSVSLAGVPAGSTITAVAIIPCASRASSGGTNPVMNVFYRFDGVNSADSGAYTLTATTPADLATTTFSGLSKVVGATSTLQVGAVLTSGNKGARLSRVATVVTFTALTAPSGLSATPSASSVNTVSLSWTDNSSTETGFLVERAVSTTTFSQIGSVGSSTTSYTDNTASAGTTYYYRVRATNTGGNSAYSNTASATTGALPVAPSSLSGAQNPSLLKIDLTWTDNSSDETAFAIERKLSSTSTYAFLATTSANTTSYSDGSVSLGTTYNYRMRSYSAYGYSAYSNVATATAPSLPGTPSLSVFTSTSSPNDAQLSFSASNASYYTIERSFNSTSSFALLATTTSTSYTDVAPGSGTWWYRTKATNNYGTSGYSASGNVTLP